jgi:nucleoporin NUP159
MTIDVVLTAGTKKEEIARFNKAKTDPEFAKMLKVRTLGPEHLETQSQLRKDIRVRY